MATVDVTLENLRENLSSPGITLLDFWAEWCAPCRGFAPVFEAASERHDDIRFGKIDTEAQPELAEAFGIRSIPTLVAFRDGLPVFAQSGALPPDALEALITAIRGLDMEEVRRQLDKEGDGPG